MIKYLTPFVISFLLTVLFLIGMIFLAKKIKWFPRKSERHIHKKNIYRIGGVAMVLAFNITILLDRDLVISPELYGLMIASLILMLVGLWDDIKELFWQNQLFSQIAGAVLVFVMGVRIYFITNPLTGGILKLETGMWIVVAIILVIFWIVLVINAMNWIDGIDGLSGGITAISALAIFILSLRPEVNQPPIAIISVILFGVSLGFLVYNFYPAKVLAGTTGATFMGLVLSVLAVFSGAKIATAILVLSIPLIDLAWVIKERMRLGKSVFQPDKKHLHYRLLELGWSQRKIAGYYYVCTIIFAIIALNTRAIGKGIALLAVATIMVCIFMVINNKISHKKKIYKNEK